MMLKMKMRFVQNWTPLDLYWNFYIQSQNKEDRKSLFYSKTVTGFSLKLKHQSETVTFRMIATTNSIAGHIRSE